MTRRLLPLAAVLALALPSTAAAQDRATEPTRQVFTFLGSRLDVRVQVEVPGTIRLIRGQGGRLEVVGRAPDGFTAFGLADKNADELQLTAAGSEPVEYVVVVPENVRVHVRLPGRTLAEVFGARDRAVTYRW